MLTIDKNSETRGRQIDIILSESDMEIFGGFLIFEISESRYSKFVIFEGFGESYQLQGLRKKSIVYHTETIYHYYQLGTRPDGSKSDRKLLTHNSNANFGILTFLPMFISDSNFKSC